MDLDEIKTPLLRRMTLEGISPNILIRNLMAIRLTITNSVFMRSSITTGNQFIFGKQTKCRGPEFGGILPIKELMP